MTIETGALEQAYVDLEASYNPAVVAALGAADGIRHLELTLTGKTNREASPEKRGTPDEAQSLPRRHTAAWNLSSVMWEPSGSPGVESNVAKMIKAGMGAQHIIATGLDTTFAAAPTATGGTLVSATGLAVGDVAAVMVGTELQATRIKSVAGLAITYDALSAAPDVPGRLVSGVNFQLASLVNDSFAVYKFHNAGSFKQATYGSVVDQITVAFDGTREVLLAIQGPAARYTDNSDSPTSGTVQAKPAAHTTIGAPAGGMIGSFYADSGLEFPVISLNLTINNNLELRNKELGTRYASGIAGRANRRMVGVTLTAYLEDLRVLAMAHGFVKGVLRLLIGDTAGSMLACVLPAVEFEIPDVGNEVGPKELTFTGKGYATNGNDQVFLAEL